MSQTQNDAMKKYKASMGQLKDLNALYEEEQKLREEQHDATTRAEKKANDLNLEIEEIKAQLEQVRAVIYLVIFLANIASLGEN